MKVIDLFNGMHSGEIQDGTKFYIKFRNGFRRTCYLNKKGIFGWIYQLSDNQPCQDFISLNDEIEIIAEDKATEELELVSYKEFKKMTPVGMDDDLENIKKGLAIDEWIDFIKNNPNNFSAWRSLAQYIDILENKNLQLSSKLQQRDEVIEDASYHLDESINYFLSDTSNIKLIEIEEVKKRYLKPVLDILNKYKNEDKDGK